MSYPFLSKEFANVLKSGSSVDNAINECALRQEINNKLYYFANTYWKAESLVANRPYYSVSQRRIEPYDWAILRIDQLGLLDYVLSRFRATSGILGIEERMRRDGYSQDNLHHDLGLLESAEWFHSHSRSVEFEKETGRGRSCDYWIELGKTELFVEVKIQGLGTEAEHLLSSTSESLEPIPNSGGRIKQRLLDAVGVKNEINNELVEPQLPLDKPSAVLLDLRFAGGVRDADDAVDAFLGAFDIKTQKRSSNGMIHNPRSKNVCALLIVDQLSGLQYESGIYLTPNPLNRCEEIEAELKTIGISN